MLQFTARDQHAVQDVLVNFGKLSLAGLFVIGSFFLTHANAAVISHQPGSHQTRFTIQAAPLQTGPHSNPSKAL